MIFFKLSDIIKPKDRDALHVSCAIEGGADYFITTDIRLLKFSSDEIKIVDPIDFIKLLEG